MVGVGVRVRVSSDRLPKQEHREATQQLPTPGPARRAGIQGSARSGWEPSSIPDEVHLLVSGPKRAAVLSPNASAASQDGISQWILRQGLSQAASWAETPRTQELVPQAASDGGTVSLGVFLNKASVTLTLMRMSQAYVSPSPLMALPAVSECAAPSPWQPLRHHIPSPRQNARPSSASGPSPASGSFSLGCQGDCRPRKEQQSRGREGPWLPTLNLLLPPPAAPS